MNSTDKVLRRLLRNAREARREASAAPGRAPRVASPAFAARVAREWARAGGAESVLRTWERHSTRWAIGALGAAAAVCLAVWATWIPVPPEPAPGIVATMGEIVFLP